jgi:hypothetical protein
LQVSLQECACRCKCRCKCRCENVGVIASVIAGLCLSLHGSLRNVGVVHGSLQEGHVVASVVARMCLSLKGGVCVFNNRHYENAPPR